MKGTDNFKNVISEHLDKTAAADPGFAEKLKKEDKSLDDCITYILNTVKQSGCNGFSDEEIYGMAIHYYDEDKIDIGKSVSGNVVVNHQIVLTEEEKQKAKESALKQFEQARLVELQKEAERKEARVKKLEERRKREEEERKKKQEEHELALSKSQLTIF